MTVLVILYASTLPVLNFTMNKFIKISVLFLLVKVVSVIGDGCRSGAKCVTLAECHGLQSGVERGERAFLRLLRQLSCGVRNLNRDPMVCCPPEFISLPAKTDQNAEFINPAQNLLPNMSVCGIQNVDRMYGGSRTSLDEHVWLARIRYNRPRGHGFYCGGVLISSRYVLTAAHCVKGEDIPSDWVVSQVRLGEWNTTSTIDCIMEDCAMPVIDVPVEEIITHSQYRPYDSNQHNDIALLRLATDVSFTDFVKPICLPTSAALRDSTFEDVTMQIAGWGKADTRTTVTETKLRAMLPVVQNTACRDVYRRASRYITETQLCAGGSERDVACRGDRGGPLVVPIPPHYNWMVIGVESYGPSPCGIRDWPGVYTRVTKYIDWIMNNIRP